jgi:D-3-phosphoglycerate dehydrogenase
MPAEQLGDPSRHLLGDRVDVRFAQWELSVEAAVEANLAVEKHGPDAVSAPIDTGVADDDVVAVLTQFFPLPAATLARWPRLRAVATLRAGTENVDLTELRRRGIPFLANAGRNANAVAELTVALVLAALRDVGENHHSVRSGGWRPERPPLGHRELAGLRLGLVGFGAVGRLVARRLAGFDLDIAYVDPAPPVNDVPGARALPLDQLLARSDVVSLHARSRPDNRAMIGARELDLLAPTAVLVNTARADLVDEDELVRRLRDGRIGGAALDVFSVEPLPVDHPLRNSPNVTLSPHLAGTTVEARSRAPRLIAEKLATLLTGTPTGSTA